MRGIALVIGVAIGLAGCGLSDSSEVGEPCDPPGATDACVDGHVCADPGDGTVPRCRRLCATDAECTLEGETCRPVLGAALSACQP